MLRYVELSDSTERPCLICGNESHVLLVKNIKHVKENTFYMCDRCFKSLKKDIVESKIEKCTEKDLSRILRDKD